MTVLGASMLRDVEVRYNLDTRDDRGPEARGRCHHMVQDAVDPESNAKDALWS